MLDQAKKQYLGAGATAVTIDGEARQTMPSAESQPGICYFGRALRAFDASAQAWASQVPPLLGPRGDGDDDPSLQMAEAMDRSLHYLLSRATFGLSPMGLAKAYFDWLVHLSL